MTDSGNIPVGSRSTYSQISLRSARLQYRSVSNGYWVAFLLPAAIYFGDFGGTKHSTTAVAIIVFNAFVLSIFRWMNLNFSLLLNRLRKINMTLSVCVMFICVAHGGRVYEVASYVLLHFTFPYMFYNLIKQHPKSFSFGEGVLITSSFAYAFWGASQNLPFPPTDYPLHSKEDSVTVMMFLELLFFSTVLGARIILLLQKPWKLFILEEMICLWSKYCIIAFFTRLPTYSDEVSGFLLMWPFKFLFHTDIRIRLVTFWAVISFLTGIFLILKNYASEFKNTTIDRKAFHLAIVLVFLPGIIWDHTLIYCCSGVVFFIFVFVEAVRVLKFEVVGIRVGHTINEHVKGFRDNQDEGRLILTPIYLLVGCSLPIWLTGLSSGDGSVLSNIQISACLSGILSIGIGDTFASIGGTYYGRTHWRDSRKTVEGTICSVIAQIIFLNLIYLSGVIPQDSVAVAALIVASIVNALVEGNTDQIDNLVLPFVTFIVVHAFELCFK